MESSSRTEGTALPPGTCPGCRTEDNASEATFCRICGESLSSSSASAEDARDEAAHRTASSALGLGLGSIVFLLLGPFALAAGIASRKNGGGRAIAGIVLGSLTTLALGGIIVSGVLFYFGDRGDGVQIGRILSSLGAPKEREVVERVPLSEDQEHFVQAYGYPNTFVLGTDDHGTRVEVWEYLECTGDDLFLREYFQPRRLYFENGVFLASTALAPEGPVVRAEYRPTEFDLTFNRDQITDLLGAPTEVRELNMQEYGLLTVLNYRDEIMVMFRNDEPFGVITRVPESLLEGTDH